METMHEKCAHPRDAIQRFGGRRRRCRICGRTWTVHPRKRGRRPRRPSPVLLRQVLLEGAPSGLLCRRHRCKRWTLQKRCQAASQLLAACPHVPVLPDGPLVLIADALRLTRGRKEWALYDLAIKPVDADVAFIMSPVLLAGRESARGWRQALTTIPPALRQRIKALVSDGLPGAETICREYGWIHQRCHWHLQAMFGGSRRPRRHVRTLLHRIRTLASRTASLAANATDTERLQGLLGVLETIIPMVPKRAWKLPGIIRQFIADIDAFRAHLLHPELELPVTTGVVESLHSRFRAVTARIHSPTAVWRRSACYVRLHSTMRCRARKHQQN